ncbi:mitochondrial outer membrane protein [Colletotrichum sojae]|uniref:Mitochondrial outer membrane protein n=1 Tax=Colletotrichum sojae TaxID=2175907 RepID=A0A8H6N1L1_9PEZI|nr:mitochondrial outer membrane protein [Colletotrichum sojae]
MPDHAPRSLFAVPAPVAALFRRFPLAVLPPNDLPLRAPARGDAPVLYVFVADEDAPHGRPSFNPSCLKWQTFLKISGVDFRILPSTNHASPSGALPYLQPPIPSRPIPAGSKLETWALSNSPTPSKTTSTTVPEGRQQAYHSLLETRVRTAWLHALYLSPANRPVLQRLYILPASNNPLVRLTLLRQVTSAAEAEVLKSTRSAATDPVRIYADARSAFEALEAALLSESHKKSEWFFGSAEPGLFDASVFAYTQLLLDERFGWADETLPDLLREFPALVRHRERLLARCFPELA